MELNVVVVLDNVTHVQEHVKFGVLDVKIPAKPTKQPVHVGVATIHVQEVVQVVMDVKDV